MNEETNVSSADVSAKYQRYVPEITVPKELPALKQGWIFRFNPGIQVDFVSRWIQLDWESLKYYENKNHAIQC
jgi:hypothetical protein